MSSPHGRGAVPVQSVDRASSVLEFLARNGATGLTEIAAALGVHTSTVSRLVGSLQHRDLVAQAGERGTFTIGVGVVRLAAAALARLDLAQLGTPVCAALAERLGETVTLAILDGAGAITVCQARTTAAVATHNWTGQSTPLHATSSGKVLLALAPAGEQAREQVLARPLPRYTPRTITEPAELAGTLGRIRDDGYATSYEELEPGLHALAVPVYRQTTEVVAALSASGPAYRMPRQRAQDIAAELQQGARELAHQLGQLEQ